jgi:hypothetical protein
LDDVERIIPEEKIMNFATIQEERGNIGRMAIIGYQGKMYQANVLDQVSGTTTPKRVRVQYDVLLQGKVLMPDEYDFKQWGDDAD